MLGGLSQSCVAASASRARAYCSENSGLHTFGLQLCCAGALPQLCYVGCCAMSGFVRS